VTIKIATIRRSRENSANNSPRKVLLPKAIALPLSIGHSDSAKRRTEVSSPRRSDASPRKTEATASPRLPKHSITKQEYQSRYEENVQIDLNKFTTQRDKIINDFILSEYHYIQTVDMTLLLYKKVVSRFSESTAQLLGHLEIILDMNTSFYTALKNRIKEWTPTSTIGEIVSEYIPKFKIYRGYITLAQPGIIQIDKLRKESSEFMEVLDSCIKEQSQFFHRSDTLVSQLTQPIGRIPKYDDFLKQLVAHTEQDHPDYQILKSCVNELKVVKSAIYDIIPKLKPPMTIESYNKKYEDQIQFEFNEKRDKIAYEIYSTETTYVQNLEIAMLIYKKKLFEYESYIQPLIAVFDIMQIIWEVNSTLLSQLKNKIKNWSNQQTIGDVILQLAPFLKTYQGYSNSYTDLLKQNIIENYKTMNPDFDKFLHDSISHPIAKNLTLESLLIQPVQRLPRYVLLLDALLKETQIEHPDYELLKKAHINIKQVALYVNDAEAIAENRTKSLDLQKLFIMENDVAYEVKPHTLFIQEIRVMKKVKHSWKPRLLFLFTDVLLLSHPSSWDLVFKTSQTDIRYKITWKSDVSDLTLEDIPDSKEISNAIIIKAPVKSFYVRFHTATEKTDCINLINNAISKAKEKLLSRHIMHTAVTAAPWVPDELQNSCSICKTSFSVVYRKHHCRKCGALVCRNCSNREMIVSEVSPSYTVKVCTNCWETK